MRVENEKLGHDDGGDADGHVDVEDPAPGVAVCEPAAQHWPKHGSDNNAESPKSDGLAAILGGKRLEEDRLRDRLKTSATRALNNTKNNQEGQTGSEPAE